MAAIKQALLGKAQGPDRFTSLYYKKRASLRALTITQLFKAIQQGGPIEADSNRAFITLILKPHKYHSDIENYCPIFLINTDLKKFTKMLPNWLLTFLACYIHSDQMGFLPHRQAADLLSIVRSSWDGRTNRTGVLLCINIRKALNSLSLARPFPGVVEIKFRSQVLGLVTQIIQLTYSPDSYVSP